MAVRLPGVSERDFSAAISAFQNVVGRDWVFTSDADVALYRDAYSPIWSQPDERVASAAVAPDSVEQVQQIVRTANTYKIPLFPISTGKNLGYGGSAPNLTGSVVVDLKRVNRILDVDDKRHYALVEPGVAYFDLYRHIQERKLNVWVDVPDPGWGSVVRNALDHGAGYTTSQFRNHWAAHCGLEVVLPNGEVMRTGMGAMPGAKNWQDYPFGFGPTVDGLFAQGNYGIVSTSRSRSRRRCSRATGGVARFQREAEALATLNQYGAGVTIANYDVRHDGQRFIMIKDESGPTG